MEPGRTIIRTTTAAHMRLKTPVSIVSRLAVGRASSSVGASPPSASSRRCPGRMAKPRIAAAIMVSTSETISQASVSTPSAAPVAIPNTGTTMPPSA